MKNKIGLLCLVIITSVFSSTLVAKDKESLPVIVLNDANKFPFTTDNNDGFLNVLLIEAFKRVGYTLKTVRLPPERGLINANEEIVDGEVNRIAGIEKKYKNLLRVPEKIRDSDFCVLSKNANIINKPEELNNHVVGYIKGWKIYEKMMSESSNVIAASSPQQLFRLLKVNRVDAVLYVCLQGKILANQLDIKGVKVLKPLLKQRPMFLYLHKKHKALVPRLAQALKDIKQEGLYTKWYSEKILPYYKTIDAE